ncbi:MAG TPA: polyribonucleotide nucleotidyltransferase [Anaerolineae bacterium]|nr:polyribonucleotide nucleotidyltransferase [Anaerolineae bacterium]HIQ09167.1 polyribonucleotide nucleotidyltransferase [Anaerolineaceae bacterium]
MQPASKRFEAIVGGQVMIFETGKLAMQAGGAVTLRMGGTMVFAAATMSREARSDIDFFPLRVDYEERMYAGGRIPGSFFRREGRPSEEAILTARLVDRPIRPLFPKDLRNDVQVILYSLSADEVHPIDILAINAASAALMISDIPWNGPVGAVRVGRINGEFVVNPTFQELEQSDLDLRIAGTREAILMVEAGAKEVAEEVMVEALDFGHRALQPIIDLLEKMAAEVGKPKRAYEPFVVEEDLKAQVAELVTEGIRAALEAPHNKAELNEVLDSLRQEAIERLGGEDASLALKVKVAFEEVLKQVVRQRILEQGIRPDGRGYTDIRPIWCEVDISPRAHGSGLFTRGETQVLTLATLGTPREAQELDTLTPTEFKRYIHHYNFPPFSTGEVRPLRGASRREIGHGALAERALLPVIPPEEEFPYTLRLVSEVLSSNGSTSMASVCGSTLALMDTGVPIKAPVAGIAMGLIKEGNRYAVLTDIQGMEDHLGDMDFKVAGTWEGITALQMDIKIAGITREIMSQALEQARQARLFILDKMLEVIPEPRSALKPHAPRMIIVQIPVDKIGAVIGPGGKTIRAIQEETDTKIDIMEDGRVFIASPNEDNANEARERIEKLTEAPEVGRIYTGRVVRVTDFGAFVEILPNTDGMVHISQLDTQPVRRVEDVVKVGDEITVMVTGIDPLGRIRLSRQAVLEGWTLEEALAYDKASREKRNQRGGRSGGRGGNRGGGRSGGRSGGRDNRNRQGGDSRGGPRR